MITKIFIFITTFYRCYDARIYDVSGNSYVNNNVTAAYSCKSVSEPSVSYRLELTKNFFIDFNLSKEALNDTYNIVFNPSPFYLTRNLDTAIFYAYVLGFNSSSTSILRWTSAMLVFSVETFIMNPVYGFANGLYFPEVWVYGTKNIIHMTAPNPNYLVLSPFASLFVSSSSIVPFTISTYNIAFVSDCAYIPADTIFSLRLNQLLLSKTTGGVFDPFSSFDSTGCNISVNKQVFSRAECYSQAGTLYIFGLFPTQTTNQNFTISIPGITVPLRYMGSGEVALHHNNINNESKFTSQEFVFNTGFFSMQLTNFTYVPIVLNATNLTVQVSLVPNLNFTIAAGNFLRIWFENKFITSPTIRVKLMNLSTNFTETQDLLTTNSTFYDFVLINDTPTNSDYLLTISELNSPELSKYYYFSTQWITFDMKEMTNKISLRMTF